MTNENDNRVLSWKNARVIAKEEMIAVNGGNGPAHTLTACTFDIRVTVAGGNGADGDINEC